MKQLFSRLALAVGLAAPVLLAHAEDQVKRGEYLARAADCMACHTAPGGAPYAGGLPIVSPFGTIYGTNITPSKEHGIGLYNDDEFFAALTEGKRRDGANLYPAMPYTSYHLIPRDDSDAIHAYLKTVEPIERAAPVTSLSFPFNVRLGLMGWNMLYGKDVQLSSTEGKSDAFKRGQYMVDVLGHCGECHTPRGLPGAMQQDKRLTGGLLNGYLAPSLLANDLAARGWNHQDLSSFLKHGMSAQGTMFNEMFPVFHNSTQGLNDPDLAAMATFLLGDQPPQAKVLTERLRRLPRGRWRRQAAHRGGHARQHHAAPGRPTQPGTGDRRRYRRAEVCRVRTHAADAGVRREAQSRATDGSAELPATGLGWSAGRSGGERRAEVAG
jgi:mono/diheme cytochrome c family protein